ncbi:MAG: hypothetical protein R3D69_12065 [Xanthobacteraceae bacterium]
MTEEFQERIRVWAAGQSDTPVLAEAIRRLVELGATVKPARAGAIQKTDRSWKARSEGHRRSDRHKARRPTNERHERVAS